ETPSTVPLRALPPHLRRSAHAAPQTASAPAPVPSPPARSAFFHACFQESWQRQLIPDATRGTTNRAPHPAYNLSLETYVLGAAEPAAVLAFSTSSVTPAASFPAMSARTLRSSPTPAAFSP